VHSDDETFRGTVQGRDPENGGSNTAIVMRRNGLAHDGRVWLMCNGTIQLTTAETDDLIAHLIAAKGDA
jgi:hypothetical protein